MVEISMERVSHDKVKAPESSLTSEARSTLDTEAESREKG